MSLLEQIRDLWIEYVLRFDKLIEEMIKISARSSLQLAFETLHGDGIMRPNALLHVEIQTKEKTVFISVFVVFF